MKNKIQFFTKKSLLIVVFFTISSNLSCKKDKNVKCQVDNFYWSAMIEGADFCYGTPTFPSTDNGKVLLTNTSPGISTSTLILSDNTGNPSLRFFGNGIN